MQRVVRVSLRSTQSITTGTRSSFVSSPQWQAVAAMLVAVAFVLLFTQTDALAQAGNALPYSAGYLVTGNYVEAASI